MVLITYNYSFHGVYKPTNITGGPHIAGSRIPYFRTSEAILVCLTWLATGHPALEDIPVDAHLVIAMNLWKATLMKQQRGEV